MARRVFELARELGVKSKDVIERCRDEGVPNVENHMATVSAGLEASIRAWFSEDAQADGGKRTAVVDAPSTPAAPPRIRKAAKKKAQRISRERPDAAPTPAATRPAGQPTTHAPADRPATPRLIETPVRLEEREAPRPVAPAAAQPTETLRPAAQSPTSTDAPAEVPVTAEAAVTASQPASSEPRVAAEAPVETAAPTAEAPRAMPNVPERPKVVRPVGPQLEEVQKPAKLSGPKVVRIEQPEAIERPRRLRPTDGRGGGGGGGGRGPAAPAEPAGPIRGGGVSRRNTRRKVSGREGRSASAESAGRTTGRGRTWGEQDLIEREERLRGAHGYIKTVKRDVTKREQGGSRQRSLKETGGAVKIAEPFTIKELSAATGVRAGEILMVMMKRGIMATINSGIDPDLAQEIMLEYNIELEVEEKKSAAEVVASQFEDREKIDVRPRPPVVTIMGHVDHGKTSLLDRIRRANVAAGEAGGITQHTSSFRVNVQAGNEEKFVVFLDTPGHEAFTSMRARGARVTDIVVLVVAADDGVMPQTVESINHAKAAGVPIIVALNKIDKPEATEDNIQRIYGQLAEHDLSPTQWGGATELVHVSAHTGQGIQDLLDTIDLQSQVMELTAAYGGPARGTVIEARMVEGRGPVANVLVQEGRIKIGDFVVMGRAYGRVRDMIDDRGERLTEAGPATPLEISGLSALPDAGDPMYIVDSLKTAEQAAEQRVALERERALAQPKVTLDNIFSQMKGAERKDLNLVVKADVQGSVETLKSALEEISNDELNIRVLHTAVGGITDSDVLLAEASGAIILGFHVIASAKARDLAEQKNVEIRTYQVIYELLDDVKRAAEGLLDPELREQVIGHAEVREVFKVTKVGMVAGCYVTDGTIERNAFIRVTRQDIVIENNRVLEQLKRFKDDVREVRAGQECGMKIDGYDDIKPGDILECYKRVEVRRTL